MSTKKMITVTYPAIAPIRLPDTSALGAGAGMVSGELASLDDAEVTGLDVVSPSCDSKGNLATTAPDLFKLTEVGDYLDTEGAANVQVRTDKDGTKHYQDLGGDKNLVMLVRRDGSGKITDLGRSRNFTVTVNKDGSGHLADLGGTSNLTIDVKPDGTGQLTDLGGDRNLTIHVEAGGAGMLTDLGGDRNLNISIPVVGQAKLTDLGAGRNLQVTVTGDGSGQLTDLGGSKNVVFTRGPGGELHLVDLSGSSNLELRVKADRSGSYRDQSADVSFDFGPDGRATDGSGYAIALPEAPEFTAPDRFPMLGKLGRLKPPCATVLRFSADVLFDFDKATLKPQGQALITKAAATLITIGKPIQVDGHTDAKGSDSYNDDLSVRRAEAFAEALRAHGVTAPVTTKGWGEKRPVAPNTTAAGKDDPGGRALNRRVEVVLKN